MFYVKLNDSGEVERYPYTPTDLRRERRDVSFPREISDADLAAHGVLPVMPQPAPPYNALVERLMELPPTKTAEAWVQQWAVRPATDEELAQRRAIRIGEIQDELAMIDLMSIRALREADGARIAAWEEQAAALRAELRGLAA